MNVLKKFVFALLTVTLIFSVSGRALALANNDKCMISESIGVQWINTALIDVTLSFDGSKAICGACVIGKVGVTEIAGKVTLEQKKSDGTYATVKTWDNLYADDYILTFDGAYYVSKGYTYRLTITATVYRNGVSETVSGYYEADA